MSGVDGGKREAQVQLSFRRGPAVEQSGNGERCTIAAVDVPPLRLPGFLIRLSKRLHRHKAKLTIFPRSAVAVGGGNRLRACIERVVLELG